MTLNSACGRFSVRCAILLVPFIATSVGQANPCPDDQNVLYRVRIEYFKQTPIDGGPTIIDTAGPFDQSWSQNRSFSDPPPNGLTQSLQRSFVGSGSASGPTMAFAMNSRTDIFAARQAGNIYGGGQRVLIDVYVRDPQQPGPSRPFYVQQTYGGAVEARHAGGAGRTDCYFGPYFAGGTTGTYVTPINVSSGFSGLTSNQEAPGAPGFFFATTVALNAWGGTWQSIDFCFPSCPGILHYYAFSYVEGYIDAGPGSPPPCFGAIPPPTVGLCESIPLAVGRYEIRRYFEATAQIWGDCNCCEYRQFVRRRDGRPGINCNSQPRDGPCPVEDTEYSQKFGRCVSYGYRENAGSPRNFTCADHSYPDAYGTGGCSYRACDAPTRKVWFGQPYTMLLDFEGKLVVKNGCDGAGTVVAIRKWTVCCEGVGGISGPTACIGRGENDPPATVGQRVDLAGRPLYVAFWNNDGRLTGTVAIPTAPGEELRRSDVSLEVNGLQLVLEPDELLNDVGAADWLTAYADFEFVTNSCVPPVVTAIVQFDGELAVINQSLTGLPGAAQSDIDADGDTDQADIALMVVAMTNPAAFPIQCPGCDILRADANCDGLLNGMDVEPFVWLLIGE